MNRLLFIPYESVDDILLANKRIIRQKIKFQKPYEGEGWKKSEVAWSAKMIECAFFCKIAKSIYVNFEECRKQYHIKYSSKMFYDVKTYSINVNDGYIIINTGYSLKQYGSYVNDLIDDRVDLHTEAEKLFDTMLNAMLRSAPLTYYPPILDKVINIANSTKY